MITFAFKIKCKTNNLYYNLTHIMDKINFYLKYRNTIRNRDLKKNTIKWWSNDQEIQNEIEIRFESENKDSY